MFLALQHSTYAAIHDLVVRAMGGCGFIIKVFIKNSLRKQTCDNLQGNKKNKGK